MRATGSTDRIRLNFASDSTIPAPCGMAPPERLVPAPRATTGTSSSWQTRRMSRTCSSVSGSATAIGSCRKAESPSHSNGRVSSTSCSSASRGRMAPSRSRTRARFAGEGVAVTSAWRCSVAAFMVGSRTRRGHPAPGPSRQLSGRKEKLQAAPRPIERRHFPGRAPPWAVDHPAGLRRRSPFAPAGDSPPVPGNQPRYQSMKKEAWRREAASYPLSGEMPTRYTDMDVWQHMNNCALINLHGEAVHHALHTLFGPRAWRDGEPVVGYLASTTDFIAQAYYPDPLSWGARVVGIDERG